jgi:hypothetical protein
MTTCRVARASRADTTILPYIGANFYRLIATYVAVRRLVLGNRQRHYPLEDVANPNPDPVGMICAVSCEQMKSISLTVNPKNHSLASVKSRANFVP